MNTKFPAVFIPHGGGPCFFMDGREHWLSLETYLRGIAERMPAKPKAVVVISAHWLEPEVQITTQTPSTLLYDYYGFPEHTYQLQYPAASDVELANEIAHLLSAQGIASKPNAERGLDHGVFVPLLLMYPEADIPVIQVSMLNNLNPLAHIQLGKALAPLREQGVLLVGSGMSFHNMRAYGNPEFTPISEEFNQWLVETMLLTGEAREQALLNWEQAPKARLCHPPKAEEHLLPLLVIAGSAAKSQGVCTYNDLLLETSISAFEFD